MNELAEKIAGAMTQNGEEVPTNVQPPKKPIVWPSEVKNTILTGGMWPSLN